MEEHTEESGELIPVSTFLVVDRERFDYLDELAHDVGEDCYSKQKAECNEDSLGVTSWIVISESNCCETCKTEVQKHKHFPKIGLLIIPEIVERHKVLWLLANIGARWCKLIPLHDITLDLNE